MNIISVASLADYFEDSTGTYIKTCRYQSEFVWDHGKHTKHIVHREGRMPEVEVTRASSKWEAFTTKLNIFTNLVNPNVFNVDQVQDSPSYNIIPDDASLTADSS